MRRTNILALVLAAWAALPAPEAGARMVAGWDFSQYVSAGVLSVDGATAAETLSANYSNFLPETTTPPFALGPNAAPFGTLYYNGQFGSSDVEITFNGDEAFVPNAGSLMMNVDAPILSGDSVYPFDSAVALVTSGQPIANLLVGLVQISTPLSLVFRADLSGDPATGTNWSVSFAGIVLDEPTVAGETSDVGIEFSTDGTSYTPVETVTLTTLDTAFCVDLGAGPSEQAFVRFNFDPEVGPGPQQPQPQIDNVAINVVTPCPEPQAAAQLGAALAALLALVSRRRSAA